MKISRFPLLLTCVLAAVALAQDPSELKVPVSGIVLDARNRVLRPMIGIPETSYLGGVLLSGVENASVSPDGSAALAVIEARLYQVKKLQSFAPETVAIDGALAGVDRFAWSTDSSCAAVYSSRSGRAQVLRGLDGNPEVATTVDVASLGREVTGLALADSCETLAIGAAAEDSGGVYVSRAGAALEPIARARNPIGLAIAGNDLFFADAGLQQVWQVSGFEATANPLLFANGLDSPVGLQISGDGKRLFVAEAGSRNLKVYDVATRTATANIPLEFTPTSLTPFGTRTLLALNSAGGSDPFYVLDTIGADVPAVYFVPAAR